MTPLIVSKFSSLSINLEIVIMHFVSLFLYYPYDLSSSILFVILCTQVMNSLEMHLLQNWWKKHTAAKDVPEPSAWVSSYSSPVQLSLFKTKFALFIYQLGTVDGGTKHAGCEWNFPICNDLYKKGKARVVLPGAVVYLYFPFQRHFVFCEV